MIIVSMPGDFAPDALLPALLRHIGHLRGTSPAVESALRDAAAERARGTCPVAVDGMLHRLLTGVPRKLLVETAPEWYAQYRQQHDPRPPGLGQLPPRTPVLIVSDAPAGVLGPIAREFRTRQVHVLGSLPAADDNGLLTGVNTVPMVGATKAERVRQLLADLDVPPARCVVHGRGSADAALFELVPTTPRQLVA